MQISELSLRNPAQREKMLFRYSRLCGTASDAVDAVILLRRIKIGNPVLLGRLVPSSCRVDLSVEA